MPNCLGFPRGTYAVARIVKQKRNLFKWLPSFSKSWQGLLYHPYLETLLFLVHRRESEWQPFQGLEHSCPVWQKILTRFVDSTPFLSVFLFPFQLVLRTPKSLWLLVWRIVWQRNEYIMRAILAQPARTEEWPKLRQLKNSKRLK